MTKTPRENFIKDLTKYILSRFPTSPDWARCCALIILSVVLGKGRKVYISSGNFRLNLFAVCLGPSQLAHKSTPMDFIVIPILKMLGKLLMKNENYFLLPQDYSFEGLIELMCDKPAKGDKPAFKGRKEGLLKKDEFSGFLKSAKKKGWQVDSYEIMSKLYDGQEISRYTKGSKEERVKGHYVNVLAATTRYVFTSLDEGFFTQGLGNRMLWVINNPQLEEMLAFDSKENIFDIGKTVDPNKFDKIHTQFVKRLEKINSRAPDYIVVQPGEAANRMRKIKRFFTKEAFKYFDESERDLRASFVFTSWTFVLKIAALNCISRLEPYLGTEGTRGTAMIMKSDINRAFSDVKKHIKYLGQILEKWREDKRRQDVKSDVAEWELVVGILRDAGGELPTGKLFKAVGKNWKDFGEIMNSLKVDDTVLYEERGNKKIWKLPK